MIYRENFYYKAFLFEKKKRCLCWVPHDVSTATASTYQWHHRAKLHHIARNIIVTLSSTNLARRQSVLDRLNGPLGCKLSQKDSRHLANHRKKLSQLLTYDKSPSSFYESGFWRPRWWTRMANGQKKPQSRPRTKPVCSNALALLHSTQMSWL